MTNLRDIILHYIQIYLQLHNCIFTNATDNSYIYNCFTLSYSSLGLILKYIENFFSTLWWSSNMFKYCFHLRENLDKT